jgi:hypothetical protein
MFYNYLDLASFFLLFFKIPPKKFIQCKEMNPLTTITKWHNAIFCMFTCDNNEIKLFFVKKIYQYDFFHINKSIHFS